MMKDCVVIVTGGSSGIGRACAIRFGAAGARVVISARQADRLKMVETEMLGKGMEVHTVVGDVSNEDDCVRLINETLNRFGRIDVLINNAGISMRAMFHGIDLKVIRQLMEVNFFGTVYCTRYAMRDLLKSKGTVVGISSIAGFQGLPGRTGYSASKFAMQGFLDALRVENLNTGLHVMTVCPGYTESNIRQAALTADGTAQGESPREEEKMMTSEEVAEHIFQGVVKRKREVVLTTQGKLAFYLRKFFPSLVDRLVYRSLEKEPNSPLK
ncbi:MAG: SDR family oxidoreductase [Flavobacteriales bacterium]|nr:SDR family oxidoreductase [Flavobacteriales bacterium]